MQLKILSYEEKPTWDRFVAQHPEATFFHRAGWKEISVWKSCIKTAKDDGAKLSI